MKTYSALGVCLALCSGANAAPPGFEPETARITKTIGCPHPKVQTGYGAQQTPLYICYLGKNEYRKVFINDDGNGRVKNIKLMWDDRTKSIPSLPSVHAEEKEAKAMLVAVLTHYAPSIRDQVVNLFFSAKKGAKFDTETYSIEFLYSQGPSMDERLLVLTPK